MVGGVDDGIDSQDGDVPLDYLDGRHVSL
jgi:hypothetical protein